MCVVIAGWRVSSGHPLFLAANRDEAHERPTVGAAFRGDPEVLCGLDLRSGGTWLGVDRRGRFATVSNLWKDGAQGSGEKSRGGLPLGFLTAGMEPERYLAGVAREKERYGPFNLLVGDPADALWMLDSERGTPIRLGAGMHVIGNVRPDRHSVRAEALRQQAEQLLRDRPGDIMALGRMLRDERPLDPDNRSPRARAISAPFIRSTEFGTRATTLFRVDRRGRADFSERSYGAGGVEIERRRFGFAVSTG